MLPIGKAHIQREGSDVTIVAFSKAVKTSLEVGVGGGGYTRARRNERVDLSLALSLSTNDQTQMMT